MAGRSLSGLTVSAKEVLLLVRPSLTETVMVLMPNWLVAGISTRARLVPLPPNKMFVSGRRVGLEEVAVTTRLLAGVSTSLTMKAMGAETVSSEMVWPAIG